MYKIIYTENEKCVKDNNQVIEYISDINLGTKIESGAMNFLDYLEKQTVQGKRLEELYTYDNIPLYYFYKPSLYEKLKEIIYYISIMKLLVNKYGESVELICDDNLYKDIAKSLLKINNVELVHTEQNSPNKKGFKFGILYARRTISGLINLLIFRLKKKKQNFIILSQSSSINPVNIKGEKCYKDTLYGDTVPKLHEKYNILNLQNLTTESSIFNNSLYKEKVVPFEFFKLYKRIKWKKVLKENNIVNNLDLLKELNYKFNSLDLKEILNQYIFKSIEEHYLSYLKEILTSKVLLSKFKIKGCLVVDEGDRARCFVTAANLLGIKTFAVQHGIITELSPAYMIKSGNKDKLIPSLTFIWGDKYKKVLLDNTKVYNDENVKVVGQVRTDYISEYLKHPSNNEAFTILYATQYPEDILKPATTILLEALQKVNFKYKLIIKLHPVDNHEDYYKEQIAKYNIKDVVLNKKSDLYDYINQSHIIISVHSSVIAEGAIFNKPSVCILLPSHYDAGGFIKDGISYGAENPEELSIILNKIYETKSFKDLKINEYLEDNFYKIDGLVYQRIIKNIEERL